MEPTSSPDSRAPTPPTFLRPILNKAEAADFLRISVRKLTQLMTRRKIRFGRMGRRVVFKRAELERFVDLLTAQNA